MKIILQKIRRPATVFFFLSVLAGIVFIIWWPEPEFFQWKVPAIYADDKFGKNSRWLIWVSDNVLDEIVAMSILISGFLVLLTILEDEDEFTDRFFIKIFKWAAFFIFFILLSSILGVYGFVFLRILMYSLFVALVLLVITLEMTLRKSRKDKSKHK